MKIEKVNAKPQHSWHLHFDYSGSSTYFGNYYYDSESESRLKAKASLKLIALRQVFFIKGFTCPYELWTEIDQN